MSHLIKLSLMFIQFISSSKESTSNPISNKFWDANPYNLVDVGARGGVVFTHYATNRQVAGSISEDVIRIFQ